jgi:hypothetical protein
MTALLLKLMFLAFLQGVSLSASRLKEITDFLDWGTIIGVGLQILRFRGMAPTAWKTYNRTSVINFTAAALSASWFRC